MNRYSLWEQPWIPVVEGDGQEGRRSLRDALARAHDLRAIHDPSPLVTVALHRLLIALIHRIFRVTNRTEWSALWRAGRFDAGQIDGYGAAWSDRFDLFHPTRPFYQVPFIADEKVHPIAALVMEAASGNNPTLFDHGLVEGGSALPPDRAACQLVMHQAFAIGGGVSKPFNRMDGPLTKGIVVEAQSQESLFRTLLLNLIPSSELRDLRPTTEDMPFWEIESPPEPDRDGTRPLGPMHYLTWQSRQIHLVRDGETGDLTGCQIRQRYCLPKEKIWRFDPAKPFRKDKDGGWLPYKVQKQRAVWQFTHVLLQQAAPNTERPALMEWLATAERLERSVPRVVVISVTGLATDPTKAAKIDLWRREQLPLPLAFLETPLLVQALEVLLLRASWVERLLGRVGTVLAWVLGERKHLEDGISFIRTGKLKDPKAKLPTNYVTLGASYGLATRFWPALEAPFRQAMAALPEAGDEIALVREAWHKAVQGAASRAFQQVRNALREAEGDFEVLTRVDQAFHVRLASILAGEPDVEGGDSEDDGGDDDE